MGESDNRGDPPESSNRLHVVDMTGDVVQARDVRGDVNVGAGRVAVWAFGSVVVAVAVLVAALVVSTRDQPPHPAPGGAGVEVTTAAETGTTAAEVTGTTAAATTSPASRSPELRVTADLSVNDENPWAYAGDSADLLDQGLLSALSQPDGVLDPALVKRVRTTPGAFPLLTQVIRLHLEGAADRAVRVTGIRPVILARRDVPRGTSVTASGQSNEASALVYLTLDDPFPVLREAVEVTAREFEPGGPYFPGHTVNLVDGETSEVVITARAYEQAYEYELAVAYQVGDRIEELRVDDGGRPFRISGRVCRVGGVVPYSTAYELGGHFGLQAVPPSAYAEPGVRDTDCVP